MVKYDSSGATLLASTVDVRRGAAQLNVWRMAGESSALTRRGATCLQPPPLPLRPATPSVFYIGGRSTDS